MAELEGFLGLGQGWLSCLGPRGSEPHGVEGFMFLGVGSRVKNWGERTCFRVFRLGVEADRLEDYTFSGG